MFTKYFVKELGDKGDVLYTGTVLADGRNPVCGRLVYSDNTIVQGRDMPSGILEETPGKIIREMVINRK